MFHPRDSRVTVDDIVDEVRLLVCPTTRGKGVHMFTDRQDMKLIEATPFENEIILLRYDLTK